MGADTTPPDPAQERLGRRRRNLEAVARDLMSRPAPPAAGSVAGAGSGSGDPLHPAGPGGRAAPHKPGWGRWGSAGAALAILLGKAKFLLGFLKFGSVGGTLLSMLFTAWLYGRLFGVAFGAGLVGLIFLHELGHWIVLKHEGLPAGAPVFIPFFGAFIGLRGQPLSAWSEYKIAIGGPLLGTFAAAMCLVVYAVHPSKLWLSLAYFGFFLNLFNLIPLHPMDGGRIAAAIHRGLWVVGYLIGVGMFLFTFSPVLLLILLFGFGNFWRAIRRKVENPRYYAVTPSQRWIAGVSYLVLIVFLILAVHYLNTALKAGASFGA